jgi:hypothetical protein
VPIEPINQEEYHQLINEDLENLTERILAKFVADRHSPDLEEIDAVTTALVLVIQKIYSYLMVTVPHPQRWNLKAGILKYFDTAEAAFAKEFHRVRGEKEIPQVEIERFSRRNGEGTVTS